MYCYVQASNVYLVTRSPQFQCSYVYYCSRDFIPYGSTNGSPDGRCVRIEHLTIQIPEELSEDTGVVTTPYRVWSPTALTGGYVRYPSSYAEPITTTFCFQPTCATFGQEPLNTHLTLVGEACSSEPSLFFTPSGNYMVLVMDCAGDADSGDISTKLQLVQFAKDPPAIHIRQLEMPFFIDLNEIHSIALDDHLGVVYLSHLRGFIFAVPFA